MDFQDVWAIDPDPIFTSQSGTASSILTLNGVSVSGGEFNDTAGKRISITSEGGNESGYTFTIVGKDLSGADQTEADNMVQAQMLLLYLG